MPGSLLAAHPTLQARWREQSWIEQPAFAAAMGRRLSLPPDDLHRQVVAVAVNAAIALAELSSLLAPTGVPA